MKRVFSCCAMYFVRVTLCPISMYLAVIALNLASFGLVAVSRRIWRFQFISATATALDRWFHGAHHLHLIGAGRRHQIRQAQVAGGEVERSESVEHIRAVGEAEAVAPCRRRRRNSRIDIVHAAPMHEASVRPLPAGVEDLNLVGPRSPRVRREPGHQIVMTPHETRISFCAEPGPVPQPFPPAYSFHHLHNRPNLRTGGGMIATPWLFPGYRPGKHLDAQSIMIRLRWLGINPLGARNSALGNLVAEVPPPLVAELLGYSYQVTQRHADLAAQPWSRYASDSPAANTHVVLRPTDQFDKIEYADLP